jgi:UDP-glucose 4-epimerase
MKVLVTGAAGYVGSTVVSALMDAGDEPIGLDDLSQGRFDFLARGPHYVGDVANPALLARIFADHPDIRVVIHCAARTVVPRSAEDPLDYYATNVAKTVAFLEAIERHGGRRVIFSSSAAVYGRAPGAVVTERSPTEAANPYAASKLMVERILADVCAATSLRALSLRYFNPIGSDPELRTGPYDPAPTHALGRLLVAARTGQPFVIHGDDWDTPDGTAVRDFVHVWDVARAHVAAAHRWAAVDVGNRHEIVNVGSGRATSVRQLVDQFTVQAATPVSVRVGPRRPGDTVGCHAAIECARDLLGWQPERSVADAIGDVLRWSEKFGATEEPTGRSEDGGGRR